MAVVSELIVTTVKSVIVPSLFGAAVYLLLRLYPKPRDQKLRNQENSSLVQNKLIARKIPLASHLLPFPLYLVDGILTLSKFRNFGVKCLEEWRQKYGKVYWLPVGHLQVLVLNDVDLVQKFLSSSNPQHLNKPEELYDRIFISWFRDGIVNSKYPIWSSHRKMLNRCFTYKSLQNYLPSINKHGKDLVKNLIKICSQNKVSESIDRSDVSYNLIYSHVLRIISDVVMGTTSLPDNIVDEFTRNFRCFKHLTLQKMLNPLLWFPPFWYFHPKRRISDKAFLYLDNFFKDITKKYREEHERVKGTDEILKTEGCEDVNIGLKPYRCLIQEMLCCGATNKEICDEVATFLAAGIDTTVVAIQMFMLHMGLNQDHQNSCREEIDQLFNEKISQKSTSQDNNDELSYLSLEVADLTKLKYLDRCILESSRITPGSPIFLRRIDSPLKLADDLELNAGSTVMVPVWSIHRDSVNYPSPEKFDPDRFLPENVKERHAYAYIPFSGGARNCIGWKMALWEVKVIMAWILRHFEIICEDKFEDVKLLFEVTLLPERNYNIILKKRKVKDFD